MERASLPRRLEELIAIGWHDDPDLIYSTASVELKHEFENILIGEPPWKWGDVFACLNDEDLVRVFRSVISLERGLDLRHSVGCWMWLFKELSGRKYVGIDDLADWALRNSENDCVPFAIRTNARSLVEFHEEQKRRVAQREQTAARIEAEQEAAKHRKQLRQEAHLRRQQANKVRPEAAEYRRRTLGRPPS